MASPSLLIVQLASGLPRPKLMERCFELCGRYRLMPANPKGFIKADPLISINEALQWITQLESVRGKAAARNALRYVHPNAESPMETVLVLILCLPTRFGGYGLPAPMLNYRIDMTGRAREMTDKSHVRCDLCWPDANLVAEYDSDWAHTGSERIASDASRRAALTYVGMHVVTITRKQIMNVIEMDRIAKVLALQLGVSLRTRKPDWRQAQLKLRGQLLDFSGRNGFLRIS